MTRGHLVAEPAVENGLIRVDAPIPQEWPIASLFLDFLGIAFGDQDFFLVVAGFGNYLAVRGGDEGGPDPAHVV